MTIEITVANPIDVDRRSRISTTGVACLEFNLTRLRRDITRTRLADLLATDHGLKLWVYHPAEARLRESLRRRVAAMDAPTIASALLLAYVDVRTYEFKIRTGHGDRDAYDEGNQVVTAACELLAQHGHLDVAWIVSERGIRTVIDRLFSLSRGAAVDGLSSRPVDVFKQLEMDPAEGTERRFHVYYLMAFKAYGRSVGEKDQGRFDQWANSVRQGYRRMGDRYFPSRRYDEFFGLLFPEMKPLLEYRPRPKQGVDALLRAMLSNLSLCSTIS